MHNSLYCINFNIKFIGNILNVFLIHYSSHYFFSFAFWKWWIFSHLFFLIVIMNYYSLLLVFFYSFVLHLYFKIKLIYIYFITNRIFLHFNIYFLIFYLFLRFYLFHFIILQLFNVFSNLIYIYCLIL